MLFYDEEIKESSLMRPNDEIVSIHKVYLNDKFDKRDLDYSGGPLLPLPGRSDLEEPHFFRDGFFPEGLESQTKFAWTEEDGNITSMVSEPSFGTTGHTSFEKDLDAAIQGDMKVESCEVTPGKCSSPIFSSTSYDTNQVSSTEKDAAIGDNRSKGWKVDKSDPRARLHYVKYVKRNGRTVRLWECGICGREFQHQYTVIRHLPTHTDERNFRCEVCSKSFRQLSTLSQHKAIHSADRPYTCEVCFKTFNRVSTLISHRKTHSNDKPYKCNICHKGFHQKGNLRNHLFTHTNERPYRCSVCLKGFNQQSNLVCHKLKAHPETCDPGTDKSKAAPFIKVRSKAELMKDTSGMPPQNSEVSSSTAGPYSDVDTDWSVPWDNRKSMAADDSLVEAPWTSSGVVVDPINTYHMGVALATKQTPFALLKSDSGPPVLVKVVDTKLPRGKQMLVPATAEDLRFGGKLVFDGEQNSKPQEVRLEAAEVGALQIRVPVVAVVVPRLSAGRLQLAVEEPHHVYNMTMFFNGQGSDAGDGGQAGGCSALPPPSPPLDISLELFEPVECMSIGGRAGEEQVRPPPTPPGCAVTAVDRFDEQSNVGLPDAK